MALTQRLAAWFKTVGMRCNNGVWHKRSRTRSQRQGTYGISSELLEARRPLTTVTWTGNAGSQSWGDFGNWSSFHVPTANDDVYIGSAGNPTVVINDVVSVRSLHTETAATLDTSNGGLTISAESEIAGTLSGSGRITVTGANATLDVSGATILTAGKFDAASGGTITFSSLTSIENSVSKFVSFSADGSGSSIHLPQLASLTTSSAFDEFTASNGGTIHLDVLSVSSTANLRFSATGAGSRIELPTFIDWTGFSGANQNTLNLDNGGTLIAPQLETVSGVRLSVQNSGIDLASVTNILNSSVIAFSGAVLELPAVTSLIGGSDSDSIAIEVVGGIVNLPNLTSLNVISGITASGGGEISLPVLESSTHRLTSFTASGSGSRLELPELSEFSGGRLQMYVGDGATILAPQLQAINDATLSIGLSNVDFSALSNIDNSTLMVSQGMSLTLPLVAGYAAADPTSLTVAGAHSELRFPALTSFGSIYTTTAEASSGGLLDLPAIESIATRNITIQSTGSGSIVSMTGLTSMTGISDRIVIDGGGLQAPALQTFSHGTLSITGSQISIPSLTSVDDTSITVSAGLLTLSGLTSLHGGTDTFVTWSTANNGKLRLPQLTSISVANEFTLFADSAGSIELPELTDLDLSVAHRFSVKASRAGSQIVLPSLTEISSSAARLTWESGGQIAIDALASFHGGDLQVSGSAVNLNLLTNVDDASLLVQSGGSLTLQSITAYRTTTQFGTGHAVWETDHANSLLSLPWLTSVQLAVGPAVGFELLSRTGSKISLPRLASVTGGGISLWATDPATVIDLPSLTTLKGGYSGIRQQNGGIVSAPALRILHNVAVDTGAPWTVLPHQQLRSGTGTSFVGPTLVSQGVVSVMAGDSLQISGDLQLDGSGVLNISASGALSVAGNVSGDTTNADQFRPAGILNLVGNSSSVNPQLIEAMSSDAGALQAGFYRNFALGTLRIPRDSSYVRLIDQSQNSPGEGAEAVYADQLITGNNVTIDLNGLRFYVHALQLGTNVTVLNGSITVMPAGGELTPGGPVSSTLTSQAEVQDWQFFGRAGQIMQITLNPADAAHPMALVPQLGFGQVTLLDSAGQVVATAASQSIGELAVLSEIILPSSGIYTLRVSAPAAHDSATGNYVLTAHSVTGTTLSLTYNQNYAGTIDDAYRVDRWQFSAVSGQQVSLRVLSADPAQVEFSLIDPSGIKVLSGLQADSGPLNLSASGTWRLEVASRGGDTGTYSFRLEQISVISMNVGDSYDGTFADDGAAQLFAVAVPENELLLVSLTDETGNDVTELYARHAVPPTRGDYDYRSDSAGQPNQQLIVSSAAPGTWYVLAYGSSVSAGSHFHINTATAPVMVTSASPTRSAQGSVARVVLQGAGFRTGMSVDLVAGDGTLYPASDVVLDTFSQITATINLAAVPVGTYSVRVTRTDGAFTLSEGAFSVTVPGEAHLTTDLILPGAVGRHVGSTFYVRYANTGNVAMPAPVLQLASSDPEHDRPLFTLDASLQSPGIWTSAIPRGFSNSIQILGSGSVPGVLEPGESVTVPVYYAGMQQPYSSHSTFQFQLSVLTQDDTTPWDWHGILTSLQTEGFPVEAWNAISGNLAMKLGSTLGGSARVLDEQATYLGSLGENVSDVNLLWQSLVSAANAGLMQAATSINETDILLPTPGNVSLSFGRISNATITGRYTMGSLGYGWSGSWDYSLAAEADGTIRIAVPGNGLRVFQPDSRSTGVYFSQSGDFGRLTHAGGLYVLSETDGTSMTFSADGTLHSVRDLNGNAVIAQYTSGRLSALTSSSTGALTFSYNAAGLVESVTSSDGRAITYSYNARNELTQVLYPDGRYEQYTYGFPALGATAHAITSIRFADGTHADLTYDDQGRVTSTSRGAGDSLVTYAYHQGLVTVTDAVGNSGRVSYNEFGLPSKFVDGAGNVSFSSFDSQYLLKSATNADGIQRRFRYDGRGNLSASTDALGHTVRYAYTATGSRLASVTDAMGAVTSFAYDSAGNNISALYADHSSSSAAFDSQGNVLSRVTQNGLVIAATWNAMGLQESQTFADGTIITYGYDLHGNLITATDESGTIQMAYDSGDRLVSVVYPDGRSLSYEYDGNGRRSRISESGGLVTKYHYDSVGRMVSVTNEADAPVVSYSYDAAGRLASAVQGNGDRTTYQYDAAGRLTHLVNFAADDSVNSQFDYQYDALGQIVSMSTAEGDWAYEWDAAGQLVHAIFDSSNSMILPDQDLTYVYNASGVRTRTIVNGVVTDYSSNAMNEITSTSDGTVYAYDAAGNLISKTNGSDTTNYAYDSLSRLISVNSPNDSFAYQYDALGNLLTTVHNGQLTANLTDPTGSHNVIAAYDSNGTRSAAYRYGLGLVSRTVSAGTQFYSFDGTGSVAALADADDALVRTYFYDPFGAQLRTTGVSPNPFSWIGQFGVVTDGNGLVTMQARSYDPVTGQFTANDPIGLSGGDVNLRRYVWNNPLSFVDPAGTDGLNLQKHNAKSLGDSISSMANRANQYGQQNQPAENSRSTSVAPAQSMRQNQASERRNAESQVTKDMNDEGSWLGPDVKQGDPLYDAFLRNMGNNNQRLRDQHPWDFPHGGHPGANGSSKSANSIDPNSLVGPAGYGPAAFVAAGSPLAYRINFENDPSATAPAQAVFISNPLDASLDAGTFTLQQIGFGDVILRVPTADRLHFEGTASLTYSGQDFEVFVVAGIDLATRTVFARFQSLDPMTQLPPDVLIGFLPPEDGTGRGSGFVEYSVMPLSGLPTGTVIRNVASIVFDTNPPINTDQVSETDPSLGVDPTKQARVTIDSAPPQSHVNPIPAVTGTTFTVSWTASDNSGSGIATLDIYVSMDGGPYHVWQSNPTFGSAVFNGEFGHEYRFFSIATDNVGQSESRPNQADATTTILLRLLAPGAATNEINPHFVWDSVPGAVSYQLWINRVGVTQNPLVNVTLTETSWTSPADLGIGKFAVWIRSRDAHGVYSAWSTKHVVQITTAPVFSVNNRIQHTATPTMSWAPVAGADHYDIWVNNLTTGQSQLIREQNVSGTSWTTSQSLPIGRYGFWVRAVDSTGLAGRWSARLDLIVEPNPVIGAPSASTFDSSPTFLFAGVPGASSYELLVRNSQGVDVLVVRNLVTTQFTPVSELPAGLYRWWIRVYSSQAALSYYNAGRDLYIGGKGFLLGPAGTASSHPEFLWSEVDGAVKYDLWVNQIGGQAQIIRNVNLTGTSWISPASLPTGTYRAWIRAITSDGTFGLWSAPLDFSVTAIDSLPFFECLSLDLQFDAFYDPPTEFLYTSSSRFGSSASELSNSDAVTSDESLSNQPPASQILFQEDVPVVENTPTCHLADQLTDALMSRWSEVLLDLERSNVKHRIC